MITMFGLSLWLKFNDNFYQIKAGKKELYDFNTCLKNEH